MHLKDLKRKTPAELVAMAEELGVEGASTMRRQDLLFSILRELAEDEEYEEKIMGIGTIEVLQDGFGFLRSPEANYLPGPDDIYSVPQNLNYSVNGVSRQRTNGQLTLQYAPTERVTTTSTLSPPCSKRSAHWINRDSLPITTQEKLLMYRSENGKRFRPTWWGDRPPACAATGCAMREKPGRPKSGRGHVAASCPAPFGSA